MLRVTDEDLASYTPPPGPPRHAWREIGELRRLMASTRRLMRSGDLDHKSGASIITRAANAIAHLLVADHRISPPPSSNPEFDEARDFMEALVRLDTERREQERAAQQSAAPHPDGHPPPAAPDHLRGET